MDDYQPRMPADRVARLRQWHDEVSEELHRRDAQDVEYLGLVLHVPAQVFAPTPTSDLLGNAVTDGVQSGQRVLDMGCGAGANAILAAQITDEVVAVDINPEAVAATIANAERNGVGDRVRAFESDGFDQIDSAFDVIVIDPPFRWFPPRDLIEHAITDENYATLGRFMGEVGQRLDPGGQVLLFFGGSGDVGHLDALIERAGFESQVIAERTVHVRGEDTTYFVRRLTA